MPSAQTNKQILIVDRDVASVEPLRHRLSEAGFMVQVVTDGSAAAAAVAERPPHLVIIDWSMPGFAALDVIERARVMRDPHPVRLIIVSELSGEQHVVGGLNTGADDYISKPFSLGEAVARVCAVLRTRCNTAASVPPHAIGGPAHLRSMEARLLEFLQAHPGKAFNRAQLLVHVWGRHDHIDERTVDVNIQRLRKFLSQPGHELSAPGHEARIETIRGFGYRFVTGGHDDSSHF